MLFALVNSLLVPSTTHADDWPHWMGPGRDNVWRESGIMNRFPATGPAILWRAPLAGGYAGPAVAQSRVVVTDYVTRDDVKVPNFERTEFTGVERVLCLNETTGKLLWKHEYPVKYTISYPAGPRCTPVIEGDHVYTLGAEGNLFCFQLADGKIVWSKNLRETYRTKAALWGYAAHPLIDGEKLITLAGGDGSHVVALNKNTGEELWRAITATEQGYAPPTIIEAAGKRQLILLRPDAVTSVDPESGKEYWSTPYEATNGSIIMSPIQVGPYLYAAGYSQKSLLLKLDPNQPGAEIQWRDLTREAISPVNVQPIADGNMIYGFDQNGELCGLQIPEGKKLWKTAKPIVQRPQGTGTAFIVRQADRYWLFNELGELIICRLTPQGYEELDRTKVIEPTNVAFGRKVVWSMPAYANRHAYIRNDEEIICVDLSAPQ